MPGTKNIKIGDNLFLASLVGLFILFFLFPLQPIKAASFSSSSSHFSFIVPSDWSKSSGQDLASFKSSVGSEQTVEGGYVAPPLNQPSSVLVVTTSQIATKDYPDDLTQVLDGNESIDSSNPNYSKVLQDLGLGGTQNNNFSFTLNSEKKYLIAKADINNQTAGLLQGYFVEFFGKNTIATLLFYTKKDNFASQQPSYQQIIDSFSWDSGYEYSESAVTVAHTIGYIIPILAIIAVRLFLNRNKTKTKNKYL